MYVYKYILYYCIRCCYTYISNSKKKANENINKCLYYTDRYTNLEIVLVVGMYTRYYGVKIV